MIINQPTKFQRLENLRGFAAVYVLLHHISSSYLHLQQTTIGTFFRFGQEAVMLFFILSGFVIAYSSASKEPTSYSRYLFKRFRRIYPIFLISLLLAWFFPVHEAHASANPPPAGIWLLGNLFMLQDVSTKPGVWFEPFFGNSPLWSLSYEWLYYLLFFPLWNFVKGPHQKLLVSGLSMIGIITTRFIPNPFSNILSLLPLWWAGAECARSYLSNQKVATTDIFKYLFIITPSFLLFALLAFIDHRQGNPLSIITYPLVQFRMYLDVFLFAFIFLFWRKFQYVGFDMIFKWFAGLAPISYALYVIHFPLLAGMRLLKGDSWFYWDLGLRIVLIFGLAWLLERPFQGWINRLTKRI